MIRIKYLCPGCDHLPNSWEYQQGMTIETIIEEHKDIFQSMVEFSLSEFTFILNGKAAPVHAALSDGDAVYILKPSFGG